MDEQILNTARAEAAESASREEWSRRYMEEQSAQMLKKKLHGPLKAVQNNLRKMQKPRMRKVEQYLCDHCNRIIMRPDQGFVVHGNIYEADPSCLGGLIGNNFPDAKPGQPVTIDDVQKTVLCVKCLGEALGLIVQPKPTPVPTPASPNRRGNLFRRRPGTRITDNWTEPQTGETPVHTETVYSNDDLDMHWNDPDIANPAVDRYHPPDNPPQQQEIDDPPF